MNPPPPPGPGQNPVDPRGTLRPPGGAPGNMPGGMPPPGYGPPMMPPMGPMMMPPMMPPPRRGGGMKAVLLTLLGLSFFVGLVVIALVLFVGSLASSGTASGAVVRNTISSGTASQTVAVVPVTGLIVDETDQLFRRHLKAIADDDNVKAVVVDISSPGGTVTDSNQMYHALLDLKQRKNVPIIVHMDDLATSGGYYIACAADEIFAEESTITGSIGVLIQYPQLAGFAEKTGIRLETIVADGSPEKDFLNTFSEPDAEDVASVKRLLNDQYNLFHRVVEEGRGSRIRAAGSSVDEVANGAVFIGSEALDRGLVDQIGFLEDAIDFAATQAGLSNPNVVRYDRPPTVFEALGLGAEASSGLSLDAESAKSLTISLLHEATSPRMLFLYQGAR